MGTLARAQVGYKPAQVEHSLSYAGRLVQMRIRKLPIKGTEKAVLNQLALYMHPDGTGMYPSQATLARDTGFAAITVRVALRRLCTEREINGERVTLLEKVRPGTGRKTALYRFSESLRSCLVRHPGVEGDTTYQQREKSKIFKKEQNQVVKAANKASQPSGALLVFRSRQVKPSTLRHVLRTMWETHFDRPYEDSIGFFE